MKRSAHQVDDLCAIVRRLLKQQIIRTVTDNDGSHAIEADRSGSIPLSPAEAESLRLLVLE